MIIAIDGPAGSGKSTIAKVVATKKGLFYLDTGAMYRMMTLRILEMGLDIEKSEDIERLIRENSITISEGKYFLNGVAVGLEIRTPEVDANVSRVSAVKAIREAMVKRQRELSQSSSVILDGRDIGTVVFPNADVKIFLTASVHERALRRYKEYKEKGGTLALEVIEEEIAKRDFQDENRKESPLKQADNALLVDTTGKTIEQVVEKIIEIVDRVHG